MKIASRVAVLVLVALTALVAPAGPATAAQSDPVKPPPILELAWDLPNWIDCAEGAGEIVGMTDGEMDNKFTLDYTITTCNSADSGTDLYGIAVGQGGLWWGIRKFANSGQHSFVWDTLGAMRVTICVIVEMHSRGSCVEVYRNDGFRFHLGAAVPVDWAAVAGAETFDPSRWIPGNPVCPAC